MYIRVTYPKIQCFTDNGLLAVGYWVWSYEAGGTTPVDTYSERTLTTPNTNPIVLNARAEADIYTGIPIKLIFTVPDGDPTNPIWEVDYIAENEGIPPLLATVTPGTTHNNYVATITPAVTSLADEQMLIITPDVDSVATIGTQSFTGTGINDAVFAGPYIGSTSGSTFTVQIDGAAFQGSGLSDVTWGGTPLDGHVYTVKISTAGATDKFEWRKDVGAWSAEVSITGAAQTLTDGVTIKFAATTGHTADDLWNNVDTFEWKKDGGAWTTGIAITAAAQNLIEGVTIAFSIKTGHTLGDVWSVQVETPVRLDFCGLGSKLVYKIIGGELKALDAGDLKAGFPSTLVWSSGQDAYILNNPSLPVLTAIEPPFIIQEVKGDYTVSSVDARHFLNCFNAGTITLPACANFSGKDVWVGSGDGSVITVNVHGGTDKIHSIFDDVGSTSQKVAPGYWDCVRFASNGAYWRIVEAISPPSGAVLFTIADTGNDWICPDGVSQIRLVIGAGGGGGAHENGTGNAPAGETGQVLQTIVIVVPKTSYLITIGAGGDPGANTGHPDGYAGGNTSLGALATATGGAGGVSGDGTGLGPENISYVGQSFGDYCNGGRGGDNSDVPYGGGDGFMRIEW